MRFAFILAGCSALCSATILQNGQIRDNPYPGQVCVSISFPSLMLTCDSKPAPVTLATGVDWKSHPANASQLSYKGRWDAQHISWWSAPGLVFGFSGDSLAISFGQWTDNGGIYRGFRTVLCSKLIHSSKYYWRGDSMVLTGILPMLRRMPPTSSSIRPLLQHLLSRPADLRCESPTGLSEFKVSNICIISMKILPSDHLM